MITITLTLTDCIETILPTVEAAMESGETCQVGNIHYLGVFERVALMTLATAGNLLDTTTGKIYRARPGFDLVGIDQLGQAHSLMH